MVKKHVRLRLSQYLPLCMIFLHETFRDDNPYIEENSCLKKCERKSQISDFTGLAHVRRNFSQIVKFQPIITVPVVERIVQ